MGEIIGGRGFGFRIFGGGVWWLVVAGWFAVLAFMQEFFSFFYLSLFVCLKSNQKRHAAAIAPHAQRGRRTGYSCYWWLLAFIFGLM